MTTLLMILAVVDQLLTIAQAIPSVGIPAGVADALVKIAQKAIQAHQTLTGQPLDMSKLHDIQPAP